MNFIDTIYEWVDNASKIFDRNDYDNCDCESDCDCDCESDYEDMKTGILIIVEYKINDTQSSKLRFHYTDTSNMSDEDILKETNRLQTIIDNLEKNLNQSVPYTQGIFVKIDGCLLRRDNIISVILENEYE